MFQKLKLYSTKYEINSQSIFLLFNGILIWLLIFCSSRIHIGYLKITWCLIATLASCLGSCNPSRSLILFQSIQIFLLIFFLISKRLILRFLLWFLFFFCLIFSFTFIFSFVFSCWCLYFRWRFFFFLLFFFYGSTSCVHSQPLNSEKRAIRYSYGCCNYSFLIGK